MSDMADVLAAHRFAADDTCACTCDEMFYDWRRTPEEVQVEHRLHVEERLHAAGFGPVREARWQGAALGWDAAVSRMVYPDGTPVEISENVNPYRSTE